MNPGRGIRLIEWAIVTQGGPGNLRMDYALYPQVLVGPSSEAEVEFCGDIVTFMSLGGRLPAFSEWAFIPTNDMVQKYLDNQDWLTLIRWTRRAHYMDMPRRRDTLGWLWSKYWGTESIHYFFGRLARREEEDARTDAEGARELFRALAGRGAGRAGDDGREELEGARSDEEVG